jgi:hypothetical protein
MSRDETSVPDPEVGPTAKRRWFTARERLRILEEAEGLTHSSELAVGAERPLPTIAVNTIVIDTEK